MAKARAATIIRGRPRALSRRLPVGFSAEIRRYALQTGLAVWAWNSLQASLFLIFWFLLRSNKPEETRQMAHGIWHEIQNDSTQRAMLLNTAKSELSDRKQLLRRIEWLVRVAGRLSTYRNVAAHTPAIFSPHMVMVPIADPSAARERARRRFNEIKHDQFWRLLTGDLNALSLYAARLAFQIYRPGFGGPLPHRPRLRSLAQIHRIEGQTSRIAQSATPTLPQASYTERD